MLMHVSEVHLKPSWCCPTGRPGKRTAMWDQPSQLGPTTSSISQTWHSDAWETESGSGTEAWLCSIDPCILTGKTLNKEEPAI